MDRFRIAAALAAGWLAACADAPEVPPAPGEALRLLLRKPDSTVEQPAVIEPLGDLPGTATFGAAEGPGWSQELHRHPNGLPYKVSNQERASLRLSAIRPCARELALGLWSLAEAPGLLEVRLNDVVVSPPDWRAPREPAVATFHVPAEAWVSGDNLLEFVTTLQSGSFETLALASVTYGPAALVTLDIRAGSAHFVDGTGARYLLELAAPARILLAGESSGKGTLLVRTGSQERRAGQRSLDPELHAFDVRGAFDAELELAPRSGSTRVLELEWSSPEGAALELARLDARERPPATRPPIVLVSIDTFAARHLSLHGYERSTSPALEAFARDAVVFTRALTNAPWTLPSYLALHTGLYPRAHRVALDFRPGAHIDNFDWWQLAPNRLTLAEALRARGYRTGSFADTYWLSPQFGFGQGFDTYDGTAVQRSFSDPDGHVRLIVEELVPKWLAEGSPDAPPFLFVHALDAHGPYWPDAPFRETSPGGLPPPPTLVRAGSINETYTTMPTWMGRTLVPDEKVPLPPELPLEDIVARYDESLLKVDAYLGKLFEHLRAVGLYDEALIVVTGDHGEFFGPDVYGHGIMSEAVLHVPLVVKFPGNAHAGRKIERGVELVDVFPTLLEVAGVPRDGHELAGRSLLAELSGDPGEERALYSEGGHVEQYALTLGSWRLVEERPGSESGEASLLSHPRVPRAWLEQHAPELLNAPLDDPLLKHLLAKEGMTEAVVALRAELAGPYFTLYDLARDPLAARDVASEHPEVLARLKALLEEHKRRSRASAAEAVAEGFRPTLSPGARKALDALGYGGGDEGDSDEPSPKDD
jgi:arylsulfatase A-like enzyme